MVRILCEKAKQILMEKNNVQVMFPSTLLGTEENCTLMKTISVTEYLNYEAGIRHSVYMEGYGSIILDAANAESHCLSKALVEKVLKLIEQYVEAMEKTKQDFLFHLQCKQNKKEFKVKVINKSGTPIRRKIAIAYR